MAFNLLWDMPPTSIPIKDTTSFISFAVQNDVLPLHVIPNDRSAGKNQSIDCQQQRLNALRDALAVEQARIDEYRRVREEDCFYDIKLRAVERLKKTTDVESVQKDLDDILRWVEDHRVRGDDVLKDFAKKFFIDEVKDFAKKEFIEQILRRPYSDDEYDVDSYVNVLVPLVRWMCSDEIILLHHERLNVLKQRT